MPAANRVLLHASPALRCRRALVVTVLPFIIFSALLLLSRHSFLSHAAQPGGDPHQAETLADGVHLSPVAEKQHPGELDEPMLRYGENARPAVEGMPGTVARLDPGLVPTRENRRRLIIIGDVHGMLDPLQRLLEEIGSAVERGLKEGGNENGNRGDHVVFVGDLINKGPSSPQVVDLAMRLSASAVRGNHEDRILLERRALGLDSSFESKGDAHMQHIHFDPPSFSFSSSSSSPVLATRRPRSRPFAADEAAGGDVSPSLPDNLEQQDLRRSTSPLRRGDLAARDVAMSLSPEQAAWLESAPAILDLGFVEGFCGGDDGSSSSSSSNEGHSIKGTGSRVVVAHAGLVPGLKLENQDPWAAMNIRSVVYPRLEARRASAQKTLERAAAEVVRQSPPYLRDKGGKWSDKDVEQKAREAVTDAMVQEEMARRWGATAAAAAQEREVVVPSDKRDREPWTEAWNRVQHEVEPESERITVVYGHDSKTGLKVGDYAIGLDSGCVRGGELSALVIGGTENGVTHRIVGVPCEKPPGRKGG